MCGSAAREGTVMRGIGLNSALASLHVCEPPVQSCLLRSLVSSIFCSLPCSAVAVESLKKKKERRHAGLLLWLV